MTAKGDLAKLRVGYQFAAELVNWNLTRDQDVLGGIPRVTIVATVKRFDTFWITQTPIDIGLWMGNHWWVLERVTVEPGNFRQGARVEVTVKGSPIEVVNFKTD